jgi:hypothetical protein
VEHGIENSVMTLLPVAGGEHIAGMVADVKFMKQSSYPYTRTTATLFTHRAVKSPPFGPPAYTPDGTFRVDGHNDAPVVGSLYWTAR